MVNFRVLVGLFSFLIMLFCAVGIPASYFGDKNTAMTRRLIWTGFVAGLVFIADLFGEGLLWGWRNWREA
jgi:hypothetical protein